MTITLSITLNKVLAVEQLNIYDEPEFVNEGTVTINFLSKIKEDADGLCDLPHSTGLREGFVYRNRENPNQSFKNVSREFLIKKGE